MLKAFKYRLYPDSSQAKVLRQHAGCCRYVFNMRQLNYELPIRGLWMSPVPLHNPDDAIRRINEINDRNRI